MALAPGMRIGSYEVVSSLGAGGMGEVYRAKDSKLKREVALKVLPADVANDRERLARFQREAEVLASLNHPHIAQIYGVEEGGTLVPPSGPVLVMELVEGEDLAERLKRGAIPLDEVLPIAKQIAEALEAAHNLGIIHRDLKPANIKVRPDGTVKVLDFGLAKAMEAAELKPSALQTAAITSPAMTVHGMILGTAAYMAPEQAKGKPVDKRADIWAFGCVLYEMLTGRMAFAGDSVADTLAKVIEREPDRAAMPASTPAHVVAVIERCLRKDPARRIHDMADARIQLEDAVIEPRLEPSIARRPIGPRAVAMIATLVAALAIGWAARRPAPIGATDVSPVQLDLLLPSGFELFTTSGTQLTISPDGSRVAFVAGGAGVRELFVRSLDRPEAAPLNGGAAAIAAVFGADSNSLGFLSRDRSLKHVSLGDGLVTDIETPAEFNAAGFNAPVWGHGDAMVFGRKGLWRLPVRGGNPSRVTSLDTKRGDVVHAPGTILPSGVVLFTSWGSDGDSVRIESVEPASGRREVLMERATTPIYAGTGHLVFQRDGALLAAPFDAATARITGTAVMVMPAGRVRTSGGAPLMALSSTGTLIYEPADTGLVTLVRVARDGTVQRISETPRAYTQPRVAPDGRRIVVEQAADSLWLHDLSRDARTPLTPGRLPGINFPIWTRDGRSIAFRRFEDIWVIDAAGTGQTRRVPGSLPADIPMAVAPDNDTLAVLRTNPRSNGDLFALSLTGATPPRSLVSTPGYDGGADFSPDGKWLLYASTDSGASQVFLSPYPSLDRKFSVSTRGGTQPRWSRSQREVFYRDGPRMMAVDVDTSRAEVQLSSPRVLFERPFTTGAYVTVANYDVTADGTFVMAEAVPGTPRLTVILNWADEVRRRVAEGQPK